MAAEYQETDWRVVDYEAYCLDERVIDPSRYKPLFIRGPRPETLEPGSYFVCLGAAQAFGRFCAAPFPTLLARRLKLPVLNISHGGAGPSFFCIDNERLLHYVNAARFVIVQAMSGRSEGNSLFRSRGVGHYERRSDGREIGCDEAFEELLATSGRRFVRRIVAETRQSWRDSYRSLLSAIRVPKISFWFSTRPPDYSESLRNVPKLFGAYPQLVNAEMVTRVRWNADHYVQCTSSRGLPHRLVDRFTGEPTAVEDPWTSAKWTENWYYPSPEMHEDAAAKLEPSCRVFAGLGDGARCDT
jgi:hypothetical protein